MTRRLGRRATIWALLLALLAVTLAGLPLFNLLGYDFCFAFGLAVAFAASDTGHAVVTMARRDNEQASLGRLLVRALRTGALLLLAPLIVICLNGVRVRNCNWAAGLAFFALLPLATALFAAPAGMLCGLVFPRRGRLIALLLPLVSIGWSVYRIYVDPPVFVYDPYGGFFPGPIYDEALTPDLRLAGYRLLNLVWMAAALALCAWLAGGRSGALPRLSLRGPFTAAHRAPMRLLTTSLLIASAVGLFLAQGRLDFHIDEDDLRRHLRRTTRSPHFIIHSDPGDGQTDEDLALFVRDLEFRHHQLRALLGVEPDGPVIVYRFASAAQKKRLAGAATTLFAKPWQRAIFIQVTDFPSNKLRHEIAHVFAARFGDPLFGVALRYLPYPRLASGLVEGVAEATDYGDPAGSSTLHQDAKALIADGRAPALAKVVGAGFTTVAGARAYTLAASFCHFLLQEFGNEKLRALYRSAGDYQSVYGRPLHELERSWRSFLSRQPEDDRQRAAARERFRQPAIFMKVCARDLAARVAQADELRGHDATASVALLRSVCADEPNEPDYQLALAHALVAAGQRPQALAILDGLRADRGLTHPVRRRAASFAASVHHHEGRNEAAREAVAQVLTLATSDGELRTAEVQARALADDDARTTLGRVMFGATPLRHVDAGLTVHLLDEFARTHPDEALGPYLVGRQLAVRDPALAVAALERACPRDPAQALAQPLSPRFFIECLRVKGESAYRARDLAAARAAWEQALAQADSEAHRLRARDFIERIDWDQAYAPE